jgi:cytochrome P450
VIVRLFTAESETFASMMSHSIYCLLSNPQQWDEVRADHSLSPAAVEETGSSVVSRWHACASACPTQLAGPIVYGDFVRVLSPASVNVEL